MERLRARNALVFYLAWLGGNTLILTMALSEQARAFIPFLVPENLFQVLAVSELFFLVTLWPLFLPGILRMRPALPNDPPDPAKFSVLMMQWLMLFLLVLPLSLICVAVSGASSAFFLKAHVILVTLSLFVASFFILAARTRKQFGSIYYMILCVTAAGIPLLAYLAQEFGMHLPTVLLSISPFWLLVNPDAASLFGLPSWIVGSLVFGAAAAGIFIYSAMAGPKRLRASAA